MQTSEGSTTNNITVTGGDHQITLSGVNIDLSAQAEGIPCAFATESGEVTLVLADGSENTLKSGWINKNNADTGISYAGLWVQEQAQVVINGGTGCWLRLVAAVVVANWVTPVWRSVSVQAAPMPAIKTILEKQCGDYHY